MALSAYFGNPIERSRQPSAIDFANQAEEAQQRQALAAQQQQMQAARIQSEQEEQANKRRAMAVSLLGGLADEPDPMKQSQLYATLKPMAERYDPTLKLPDQFDPMLTKALAGSQIDPATRMTLAARKQDMEIRQADDATRAAAAQEAADQKAAEKDQAAADRGAQAYSQRVDQAGLAELLPAVNNAIDKLTPYATPDADVPGFGGVAGMLPDFAVSQEGKDLRQAYSGVRNAILKARSGGAVTPTEADRLLQELGEGTLLPDQQVIKGMVNVSNFLKDRVANMQAGFSPDAIDTYRSRGGTVTTDAVKQIQAPSTPKIGAVEDGYVYLGGDPADQKSWKAAR